jgi:SAM-dependent methyltransferase
LSFARNEDLCLGSGRLMDFDGLLSILICPTCGHKLSVRREADALDCPNCSAIYEIYDNKIPILLNEDSKREIGEFYQNRFPSIGERNPKKRLFRQAPDVKLNNKREKSLLHCLVLTEEEEPKILTIGNLLPGEERKNDIETHVRKRFRNSLRMDIIAREGIHVVGDGHRLPFMSSYFDCVVAQAAIKHLRNPFKFMDEVYRVLKPGGILYCEVAYLLPYHRWPGDYIRFTPLGLKELLKNFDIIESNYVRGPSQTIADFVSIYFAMLLSFKSKLLYSIIIKGMSWLVHPIKYFDLFLWKNPWSDLLSQVNYCIAQKSVGSKSEI